MGEIVNLRRVRKQKAREAAADIAAANRAKSGVSPAALRAGRKAEKLAGVRLDGARLEPPRD